MRHKFSSQGPALRILGLRARESFPGSWVSESHVPESQFQGPRCQGPVSHGPRVPGSGPGSQALILDYALEKYIMNISR